MGTLPKEVACQIQEFFQHIFLIYKAAFNAYVVSVNHYGRDISICNSFHPFKISPVSRLASSADQFRFVCKKVDSFFNSVCMVSIT